MTKKKKVVVGISIGVAGAMLLALLIPFSIFGIRSASIDTKYSYLKDDETYNAKAEVTGVELVTQHISCGYAIIEMLSDFYGKKVTEKELSDKNGGGVSTQTTSGFVNEINETISGANYVSKEYLKNDELLLTINSSLQKGKPVPVEWAAKLEDEWTLHWSIVTGMDEQTIYINNPYGYYEQISYDKFIERTTFKPFDGVNFFQFGFAFGLFSKNTVIVPNE